MEGGYPHEVAEDIENVHKLVYDRFDPNQGRFKNEWEVKADKIRDEEHRLREAANKPAFKVPDSLIDDWTGQRFVNHNLCDGHPCTDEQPRPIPGR